KHIVTWPLQGDAPHGSRHFSELSTPRSAARNQPERVLLLRSRLPQLPSLPRRILGAVPVRGARLLSHDESCSSAADTAHAGRVCFAHEEPWPAVCARREPPAGAPRDAVGGTLFFRSRDLRHLSAPVLPIRRAQSCPRPDGRAA